MTNEQHHQGSDGNTPVDPSRATQPGDPGAVPPNADLSSDGAAPGTNPMSDWIIMTDKRLSALEEQVMLLNLASRKGRI